MERDKVNKNKQHNKWVNTLKMRMDKTIIIMSLYLSVPIATASQVTADKL